MIDGNTIPQKNQLQRGQNTHPITEGEGRAAVALDENAVNIALFEVWRFSNLTPMILL